MTTRNTGSFPQYPRLRAIQLTGANTNYTTPANNGLLWVAGPDGSDIANISAMPYATVATANQLQFFTSPDGGTTFNLLPMSAFMPTYTMAQTTAIPVTVPPMPNALPMSASNPLYIPGISTINALAYAQSTQSELTNYYYGGMTQGSANALTLPYCYNASGTLLSATPATGTIVDFESNLTNTTTTTIAPGSQAATALKRTTATQLSAGDVTAGFRYRMVFDGTQWILGITTRLYCAQGQAQNSVFTAWGQDR